MSSPYTPRKGAPCRPLRPASRRRRARESRRRQNGRDARGAEQRHLLSPFSYRPARFLRGDHVARSRRADRRRARPQCTSANLKRWPATSVRSIASASSDQAVEASGGGRSRSGRREPGGGGAAEPVVAEAPGHLVPNIITCQPRGDGGGGRGHELFSSEGFLRPLVRFASSGAGQGQPFFWSFWHPAARPPRLRCKKDAIRASC